MIRSRFGVYWILFLLSSLCLAGVAATFVFKELVRFREQSDMSVMAQQVQTEAQLASLVDEVRTESTRQLVGFHAEGLEFQLNKWENENTLIQDACLWSPATGLKAVGDSESGGALIKALNALEILPWENVWNEMGVLRSLEDIDDESVLALDVIHTRSAELQQDFGYLVENADILQYDGIESTPYLGWLSVEEAGGTTWIFWHQLARDSVVRAFSLDLDVLSEQAQQVVTNFVAADIEVRLSVDTVGSLGGDYSEYRDLGAGFPGWYLSVEMNEAGRKQETIILLTGILVVGLFLLLIVGGSALIFKAHASYQDMLQKTTFVSAVSHELKTPLTSIRMYAELMGDDKVDTEKRVQYADTIHRESQRLTSLINNLLTFSSLENGKRKYRQRVFDLVGLVELTAKDYGQTIRASGFECDLTVPEEVIEVNFDESVVKLVLINLIENVLKHAKDGAWLGIRVEHSDGTTSIDVTDHGPGIESEICETIFDPFVQGSDRLDNKKSGTGLGLSIARSMMRDCGGDLILLGDNSKGATFRMIIR